MDDAERFRLLGKYRTPRFRIGQRVFCEVRGEMVITGMTDAPILWPIGKRGRGRHTLVVYKGLAKAVRRESEKAICHWWKICPTCVWKWRKALGVGFANEGTHRLLHDHALEPQVVAALAKAQSKSGDPERCRKITEARRGKPRPQHVMEAARQARRGSHHTKEAKRRMSETHRRRGTLVPGTVPWTAQEDAIVHGLRVTTLKAWAAGGSGAEANSAAMAVTRRYGRFSRICDKHRGESITEPISCLMTANISARKTAVVGNVCVKQVPGYPVRPLVRLAAENRQELRIRTQRRSHRGRLPARLTNRSAQVSAANQILRT
jgi:hypothetical protein